jgi:hypothetical protein
MMMMGYKTIVKHATTLTRIVGRQVSFYFYSWKLGPGFYFVVF